MLLLAQILAVLVLLPVCCLSPGLLLVRRLRLSPLERLVASTGASLVLLYLYAGAVHLLRAGRDPAALDIERWPYRVGAILCVAAGVLTRRDLARLLAWPAARKAAAGFAALFGWAVLLLCWIRHYSGGAWYADWLEHFQRTLFFLRGFPVATPVIEGWHLTSRPPLMNLVAAFFLGQTQDRFELFQITFAFLNALAFLPCFLLAPALSGRNGRRLRPFLLLFLTSPLVLRNVTYTWTKLLAAFFVLTALWFYSAGLRKGDRVRVTLAFLSLAAGCLTHYSAGVFAAAFLLHYVLFALRKRPTPVRELVGIGLSCSLLGATWLGWAMASFGVRAPFTSHHQLAAGTEPGQNVSRILANVRDTVIPYPLRGVDTHAFDQPNRLGALRDRLFLLYQMNLLFALGSLGWIAVGWLLPRSLRLGRDPAQVRFWVGFLVFCGLGGIAVAGEREPFGIAHVCLQALILLGLSLVASSWRSLPALARVLVGLGCLADLSLGVLLPASVEHLENTPRETVFSAISLESGRLVPHPARQKSLSEDAWGNWFLKHQLELSADAVRRLRGWRSEGRGDVGRMLEAYEFTLADDAERWHGWYSRNGGAVTFLGDHVADLLGECLDGFQAPDASGGRR